MIFILKYGYTVRADLADFMFLFLPQIIDIFQSCSINFYFKLDERIATHMFFH